MLRTPEVAERKALQSRLAELREYRKRLEIIADEERRIAPSRPDPRGFRERTAKARQESMFKGLGATSASEGGSASASFESSIKSASSGSFLPPYLDPARDGAGRKLALTVNHKRTPAGGFFEDFR